MTTTTTKHARVKIFGSDATIEIAPGAKTAPLPTVAMPRVAVARLQAVGGGDYRPVVKVLDVWVRLHKGLPAELGIDVSDTVLRRLVIAGFVESRQVSPFSFEINLESLERHLEACKDKEFWTPRRREIYRQAIG